MHVPVASKSLDGISELTIVADLKGGCVGALETSSYATRFRRTMATLMGLRKVAREYATVKLFSDTVERIRAIQSFRIGLLGEKVLLAVTFDRALEPYVRLLWDGLGPMLDLVFCHCEGYPTTLGASPQPFARWIDRHRLPADFFYVASSLTVSDADYLVRVERLQREGGGGTMMDMATADILCEDPRETAACARAACHAGEIEDRALLALGALHRLTDHYLPGTEDGRILHRAARDFLSEFEPATLHPLKQRRFKDQLRWFEAPPATRAPARPDPPFDPANVQGGILTGHGGDAGQPTHGCLVLMKVDDPVLARAFLAAFDVTRESDGSASDGLYRTIAFTPRGLTTLGVAAEALGGFPPAFLEGMEERAGYLGDARCNHPGNWRPPRRNWPATPAGSEEVLVSSIDMVVQLRMCAPGVACDIALDDAGHPLRSALEALARDAADGATILAVEALHRHPAGLDHFGFVDGLSQPVVTDAHAPPSASGDGVRRGDLLWGYANGQGDPAPDPDPYLTDGSFLVVRKLRQNVAALDALVRTACAAEPGLTRDLLLAKMVGRRADGTPLVPSDGANGFDYADDPRGARCPLQSHIRRTNPRDRSNHAGPTPRIMRRGMSYGPRAGSGERGIMFMAYVADIAEQFEVIQRWITGGNSSGLFSAQSDPLLGVPRNGDPRTFRFVHEGRIMRVPLDDPAREPPVVLEWGLYLFAPSITALRRIAAGLPAPENHHQVARGEALIQAAEQVRDPDEALVRWRTLLEDGTAKEAGDSEAAWAAVRDGGGARRTRFGVLVGDRRLAEAIFRDEHGRYSVGGYQKRLTDSIGPIYLGEDEGDYPHAWADAINAAIGAIDRRTAFDASFSATRAVLAEIVALTKEATGKVDVLLDLRGELFGRVLAVLSLGWFGLPDGHFVRAGELDLSDAPEPRCPGSFAPPSRATFYPHPGAEVRCYARREGQALRRAVAEWLATCRDVPPTAPLTRAIIAHARPVDDDSLASTIVGVMMGFLPTTAGSLGGIFHEWLGSRDLWRLQDRYRAQAGADAFARAEAALLDPLLRAMQRRPAPEMVWRTALRDHSLGSVRVREGDRVIVGIVSATAQAGMEGDSDVSAIFGGRRSPGGPLHACPGYEAAIGVLLGVAAGVIDGHVLRPGPAPLTLRLIG